MTKVQKNKKKLVATTIYNKKIAMSFHDLRYYESEQDRLKYLSNRDIEKRELSTSEKDTVTNLITKYRNLGLVQERSIFNVLDSIRTRVISNLKNKDKVLPTHNNLINLVSNPYVLLASYRSIRKNKGTMTEAFHIPPSVVSTLSLDQQELLNSTQNIPDGISWNLLEWISISLKKGTFIWGASRRIGIPKPGTKKLRPITIPPFVDKMVQGAILMVLEAIYEPFFVQQNCAFGFRAGVGTHEAITKIKEPRYTSGMTIAIEGDIEQAYPNLVPEILLEIMGEKIKDKKLLNLMRKRLHLTLFDVKEGKYQKTFFGVPQGGIDSPYLFNIYLLGMDEFITNSLTKYCNEENLKRLGENKKIVNSRYLYFKNLLYRKREKIISMRKEIKLLNKQILNYPIGYRDKIIADQDKAQAKLEKQERTKRIYKINQAIKDCTPLMILQKDYLLDDEQRTYLGSTTLDYYTKHGTEEVYTTPKFKTLRKGYFTLFDWTNQIRKTRNKMLKTPYQDPNTTRLRFCYTRYADDFIILGNFSKEIAEKIKLDLENWLKKNRKAILSPEKTLITPLKKGHAHFLGFEVFTSNTRKLGYVSFKGKFEDRLILRRTAGWNLRVEPDKQRLISRLHMKGYCDKKGFPISIPWISGLESHIIIQKFNSVAEGLANFYTHFVTSNYKVNRWLYIIRWSCIKTLAQKYNTTVNNIIKKFGGSTRLICSYFCEIKSSDGTKKLYEKEWILLTEKELREKISIQRSIDISKNLLEIDKGAFPHIPIKETNRTPRIMDENFLEKINWVNIRTQAQFDMPCSLCGSTQNIEMHHIKHVRK